MRLILTKDKSHQIYTWLLIMMVTVMIVCLIVAPKVVYIVVEFPFSSLLAGVFLYPLIDIICELWGKGVAIQTIVIALASQILAVILFQLSVYSPHVSYWVQQPSYIAVVGMSFRVVIAGIVAFGVAQTFDVLLFQALKKGSNGKLLWVRFNLATIVGHIVDTAIFTVILFGFTEHTWDIFYGSSIIKIIFSVLMTPIIYWVISAIDNTLKHHSLAFHLKNKVE